MPSYSQFLAALRLNLSGRSDARIETGGILRYRTADGTVDYESVKVVSEPILAEDRIIIIRAGIHGDEVAGPLTLMKYAGKIFDYARLKGVKLVVFPLDNPSGFEAGTRYNVEGDRGDAGNNDFVRYQLQNGEIADDLGSQNEFDRWYWSSDPRFGAHLPEETRWLHRELKKIPFTQVGAVLDIHGDNFISRPYAYHYGFGDLSVYRPIVEKISGIAPILAHAEVNSGYLNGPGFIPEVVRDGQIVPGDADVKSDELGFIVRHDGSLPDLASRLGVRHAITVETTAGLSQDQKDSVNLIWVYGLIDLVAAESKRPLSDSDLVADG